MILQRSDQKKTLDMTYEFRDIDVRLTLEMPNDDASGKTSSTETLSGGIKPKKISVSCTLPMKQAELLTELIRLAESIESDGSRTVYTVSDTTADAADIREVIFHDRLDVRKRNGLMAWQIAFVLREHKSVPEVKEQRSQPAAGSADTAPGAGIQPEAAADEGEAIKASGPLYDILKKVDEYLAPIVGGESEN